MIESNEKITFELTGKRGMGWQPDLPDFRDYTPDHEAIRPALAKAIAPTLSKGSTRGGARGGAAAAPALAGLAPATDLRPWFSPIEDQGQLGSCTANAGIGLVEYFERRAFGKHIDASRLFLYKVTRNLLHWTGDTGAYLRTTMKALVCFGAPPEEYWPYTIASFDKEPPAFAYAYAQNFQAIKYYRLDPPGTPKDVLLNRIKTNLAAGLPSMFGFTVYSSIAQADHSGKIPYPTAGENVEGGHAMDVVGYDDNLKIKNTNAGAVETKGAFMVRNSWGTGWGNNGYGWLPYDYVLKGLADDWWSLIQNEWIDTGQFA